MNFRKILTKINNYEKNITPLNLLYNKIAAADLTGANGPFKRARTV